MAWCPNYSKYINTILQNNKVNLKPNVTTILENTDIKKLERRIEQLEREVRILQKSNNDGGCF